MDLRKIDALVAEHVIGLEPWPNRPGTFSAPLVPFGQVPKPCTAPEYSTDIAAAWDLIPKIQATGPHASVFVERCAVGEDRYHYRVYDGRQEIECCEDLAGAETAPLAICLAALKAKGVSLDGQT